MNVIGYFKAEPTQFARVTVGGKVSREGQGIACWYMPHRTSIEVVETATVEAHFAFPEQSKDNQEVNLQGGVMYRIVEPGKALARYNFAINPGTRVYVSDQPLELPTRIMTLARESARQIIRAHPLETLLVIDEQFRSTISGDLAGNNTLGDIGLEIEGVYITGVSPNPEMAKALGAQYREGLLRQQDDAVFDRRANAVARENSIADQELEGRIAIEKKKEGLVDLEGHNREKEAEFQAKAKRMMVDVFSGMNPELLRAYALAQMGENAEHIGQLTITPELLAGLQGAMR